MVRAVEGILLIDKEEGETSYDVVRKVKKVFPKVKVGHAGTLDPFATGLLVLLLGAATKVSRFLMREDKVYWARVKLGVETDTLDPTGRVTGVKPVPRLSWQDVKEAVRGLVGEVDQIPPSYSALRIGGKRAYELARRGEAVVLRPRRIKIHSVKLLALEEDTLEIEIDCSAGTYIRSLASDLAQALGTCGHLLALRRVRSGCLFVDQAMPSGELNPENADMIGGAIHSLKDSLCSMEEVEVSGALAAKIRNGYQPRLNELRGRKLPALKGEFLKVVCGKELVAIVSLEDQRKDMRGRLRLEKVFPKVLQEVKSRKDFKETI